VSDITCLKILLIENTTTQVLLWLCHAEQAASASLMMERAYIMSPDCSSTKRITPSEDIGDPQPENFLAADRGATCKARECWGCMLQTGCDNLTARTSSRLPACCLAVCSKHDNIPPEAGGVEVFYSP